MAEIVLMKNVVMPPVVVGLKVIMTVFVVWKDKQYVQMKAAIVSVCRKGIARLVAY